MAAQRRRGGEDRGPTMRAEDAVRALVDIIEDGEDLLRKSASAEDVDMDEFDVWQGGAVATARAALGADHVLASRISGPPQMFVLGVDEDFPPGHFRQQTQKRLDYLRQACTLLGRGVAPRHSTTTSPAPIRNVTVNVNAPAGVVNLGDIFGDVRAQVNALAQSGHDDIASAIRQLADAIASSRAINEETKRDAGELLTTLAEQAQLSPSGRRSAVIRAAVAGISTVVSTAADLTALWAAHGGVIRAFFGLP